MTKRGSRLSTARGVSRARTRRTARTGALRFAGRTSTADALSTTPGGRPGNEGRRACVRRERPAGNARPRASRKTSYAAAGWSPARAPNAPLETRPKNWRERIGAEAAAELVALGDVFAERRRETAGVTRGSLLLLLLLLLMGRVVFLPTSPTRASRPAARPETVRRFDSSKKFGSERSVVTGSRLSGARGRPSLSSVRLPATLTADHAGLAAACLFVCVAAARLRERRRTKRVAKKARAPRPRRRRRERVAALSAVTRDYENVITKIARLRTLVQSVCEPREVQDDDRSCCS